MDCWNAVGIIYLDFSKTFDNVVPDILISEQFKYGLGYMTNRCIVGLKIIFNSFINSSSTDLRRHGLWCYKVHSLYFLDEKVQGTFIKFANDTKLDKILNILEDKI